jgi:nitric oxide dioxygenase
MPFGDFTLDVNTNTPVVLISGGVGITPMMSMLSTVVEQGSGRPVVFVHAVHNSKAHAMKDYLSQIMSDNPQVSRAIFYGEVNDFDHEGVDYDFKGRIELSSIKDRVLLPDADYYLCGPVPFMSAQQEGLESLGVPSKRIHSEVFGAGVA